MKSVMACSFFFYAISAAAIAAHAQHARYEGPWCANVMVGGGGYAQRCDMRSLEMCHAEIRGQGSSHCVQNPFYYAKQEPAPRKRQRVH